MSTRKEVTCLDLVRTERKPCLSYFPVTKAIHCNSLPDAPSGDILAISAIIKECARFREHVIGKIKQRTTNVAYPAVFKGMLHFFLGAGIRCSQKKR